MVSDMTLPCCDFFFFPTYEKSHYQTVRVASGLFPGAHFDPPFLHSDPGLSTLEAPGVTSKVASAICRLGPLKPTGSIENCNLPDTVGS